MELFIQFLPAIFEIIIFPLLAVITGFIVNFISLKSKEIRLKIDNDTINRYVERIENIITKCVVATNQTYVDTLKEQNAFDQQAQEKALQETYSAVTALLSQEILNYLNEIFGDSRKYLLIQIEAKVHEMKK